MPAVLYGGDGAPVIVQVLVWLGPLAGDGAIHEVLFIDSVDGGVAIGAVVLRGDTLREISLYPSVQCIGDALGGC
ncbi:hypothetical protein [Xylella fastidiosa]|uniref:hypothetical protein n=1 Tax=Xylella fastidiosa TaxID=2371 RepID=UPI001E647089|nr:hypothetical protein [Xylella fastidiosa]MDG5822615.1 hypothetical protein [Xylella fastidiosa subsp. pauca]MDG5826116.1 hypothetical protein [Xylella fastidiosa subsp. pauca]